MPDIDWTLNFICTQASDAEPDCHLWAHLARRRVEYEKLVVTPEANSGTSPTAAQERIAGGVV